MAEPSCFISYSWDSEEHREWVRLLAEKLQRNGVLARLDQWDVALGDDLTTYMETAIRESNFIILVCTPNFALKANKAIGGVGYEKSVVTGEIFGNEADTGKFVPILRDGTPKISLPSYLKSRVFLDFREESVFNTSFEALLRHLHRTPKYTPPPFGQPPSFGETSPSQDLKSLHVSKSRRLSLDDYKRLVNFAYSGSGLDMSKAAAADWASEYQAFFQNHDFDLFKRLVSYAYSGSGLDMNRSKACQWALQNITLIENYDFGTYEQLVGYAYSGSGLDMNKTNAAN
ncbi:toll/interleukin-1 receptor domain-containing protein [bacterium]|nr:toll/interleukin-1 receptor domain-containing protein [bacterium]